MCSDQQQCELQEEVKTLRGQLEQFRRTGEQKTCLQALLEQRTQEGRKSKEVLEEKMVELELRQQEAQQHMASLDEARAEYQNLHTEADTLRLKLEDKEKMIDILRVQLESSIEKTAENGSTIDNLHQENGLLSNQLNQHKLEILHLRAELDHHKSSLAAVEHERGQLQASVAEHSHRVQEETLAKQQLTIQLEQQRFQLLSLTEEHKELQQFYSCKNKESEGVVLKLQSHLKNVQTDLDQVRSTLRTLEATDGHGVQVALSMQKEITARRKQINSLQSKIQHLEETKGKPFQTKPQQGSPTSELRSLVRGQQGVISEKHRPPTANTIPTSSIHRRRSAPESVQRTAFSTDKPEVMCGFRLRGKHCGRESHALKTTELNGKMQHNSFSQEPLTSTPTATTSSPQLLCLGRRSPVHSLLTSDPNS